MLAKEIRLIVFFEAIWFESEGCMESVSRCVTEVEGTHSVDFRLAY